MKLAPVAKFGMTQEEAILAVVAQTDRVRDALAILVNEGAVSPRLAKVILDRADSPVVTCSALATCETGWHWNNPWQDGEHEECRPRP